MSGPVPMASQGPFRRAPGWTLALAAGAAVVAAGWWALPPDPGRELARLVTPLARVVRVSERALGPGVERWRMISAAGDTAFAIWRPAQPAAPDAWTVVMMGGLGTGDRAALLLPGGMPVNALAVDWPWRGPRKLTPFQFALRLPTIRRAVLRSPIVLARGVEACARAPGVDSSRVVLLGASLGVPPALAALRVGRRPAALVLLDGGTDLGLLLRVGLEREGVTPALAGPLAALAFRLVRSLEPALNAPAARGLPVLLVNGDRDRFLPRRSIAGLWAALPQAGKRWRRGPHLRPDRPETIAALSRETLAWLESSAREAPGR